MKQSLEISDLKAYQSLLEDICDKIHVVEQSKKSSIDLKFYTQKDVERMTGMSIQTIQKLFNDP